MWSRILWLLRQVRVAPSFVFEYICLSGFFFFSNHAIVILFSTYDFECRSSIFLMPFFLVIFVELFCFVIVSMATIAHLFIFFKNIDSQVKHSPNVWNSYADNKLGISPCQRHQYLKCFCVFYLKKKLISRTIQRLLVVNFIHKLCYFT